MRPGESFVVRYSRYVKRFGVFLYEFIGPRERWILGELLDMPALRMTVKEFFVPEEIRVAGKFGPVDMYVMLFDPFRPEGEVLKDQA
jgi:hypothetical protein